MYEHSYKCLPYPVEGHQKQRVCTDADTQKVTLIWKKPYENGAFLEHGDKQHIANDKVDHTL